MLTTLLHRRPEQYPHKSLFKLYLQYFCDVGASYIAWLNTPRSAPSATLRPNTLRSGVINYFLNSSQPHTSAHTCSSGIYPLAEPVVVCVQNKLFPDPLQKMCLNVWEI